MTAAGIDLGTVVATDVHTHAEVSARTDADGDRGFMLRENAARLLGLRSPR